MRGATILQNSRCGYYSRVATNQGVASVRINKVTTKVLGCVSADLACMVLAAYYAIVCNVVYRILPIRRSNFTTCSHW